jgi:NAD-dependent DNA ligase
MGINLDNHHSAKDDAKACAEIAIRILKIYDDNIFDVNIENISIKNDFRQKNSKTFLNFGTPDYVNIDLPYFKFNDLKILSLKNIVITGQGDYPRYKIEQAILDNGGYVQKSVNRKTTCVIVGKEDLKHTADSSGKSLKIKKAEELNEKGLDIKFISIADFEKLIQEETTIKC